ncbi:FHA domain-containing protein [Microlunatus capsulatus]|uniref:FHA domain-containing protein n=1 Tax=Microlunatus capsulatus TaxID=99117 RepID=UPI0031D56211
MSPVGRWRATYAPGDWLVLCGPTSLVVVEPPGEGWTPLVEELWQQVLASSSLVDLAARMAGYGLDTMPSFGALFWTEDDGMRSLVRGAVAVVDPADGRVVAEGAGIQTWSEVGLGRLSTVLVRCGSGDAPGTGLRLPLVVGAVQASSVLLDAREDARAQSPQPVPAADADRSEPTSRTRDARGGAGPTPDTELPDAELPDTEPLHAEEALGDGVEPTQVLPDPAAPAADDPARAALENADTELVQLARLAAELGGVAVPPAPPTGPVVDAVVCPHGHANPPGELRCRDCGVAVTDQRTRRVAQPVLAVLRVSDGAEVPVDRTVLVGRAPAARGAGPVRLLTVPSPAHDISRTHLEVAVDGWRVTVTDLHSTNGTLLVDPAGGRRSLPPGQPVPVRAGDVLELAEGVSVTVTDPR